MISFVIIVLLISTMGLLLYFFLNKESISQKLSSIEEEIKIGDYDTALSKLLDLKKKYKDTIEINWFLAQVYDKKGEYHLAEEELEKIIGLNRYTDTITELMCRKFLGDIYYKNKKFDNAFKEYLTVLKLNPDDVYITMKLGEIALNKKSYRDALLYFMKYQNLNPTDPMAYYYIGIANFYLRDFTEAETNLKKALELNNALSEAHYYLGEIYMQKQQYQEAVKEFSFNQKQPELKFQSILNAGKANYYLKNYFETINNLKKIVQSDLLGEKEKKDVFYIIADSFQKSGDIESALKYFNIVKEIDPYYKDIERKIIELNELRKNNILDKFTNSDTDGFIELGKEFSIRLGFVYKEHSILPDGSILDILASHEIEQGELVLIEFIRSETTIGELIMREIKSKMRDFKTTKAICVSTAEFSESAIRFARENFIELYGKDDMIKIFTKKNK